MRLATKGQGWSGSAHTSVNCIMEIVRVYGLLLYHNIQMHRRPGRINLFILLLLLLLLSFFFFEEMLTDSFLVVPSAMVTTQKQRCYSSFGFIELLQRRWFGIGANYTSAYNDSASATGGCDS